MSLKLKGHPTLWQWDAGRQLIVLNEDCNEVHFCNGTQENALVCLVKEQNGERVVDVPNILLQQAKTLTAYEHHSSDTEDDTFCGWTFPVRPRNKPADYIYTETELLRWETLDTRIKKLEDGGGVDVTGAEVGQIIKVSAVDGNGKPTAWEAVNPPTKLSDLENDLWYSKCEPVLTLNAADFVPVYYRDEDGNLTEELDCYEYKGSPQFEWFTKPNMIGFSVTYTEDGEQYTYNHHVPNAESGYIDDSYTESGYADEDNRLYPWFYCDECGVEIQNGGAWNNGEGFVPGDHFLVSTWWYGWDGELNAPTGVGFDSITIYKVDEKKVPIEYCDISEYEKEIENQIYALCDEVWDI